MPIHLLDETLSKLPSKRRNDVTVARLSLIKISADTNTIPKTKTATLLRHI